MKCTWKDCHAKGMIPQKNNNGSVWATLCGAHHKELEDALSSPEPKKILRAWVLASGGAKIMAKKM